MPCLTLGPGLADLLTREAGASCRSYPFAADPTVYSPADEPAEPAGPAEPAVCFYARPSTPRRGTDLGLAALALVAEARPDLRLHLFGGRPFRRLPFAAEQHGPLTEAQLAALYRRCRVGLSLSFTNTSLAPMEMLGCGCTPVVNDTELNRRNLEGSPVAWTAPTPAAIAEATVTALDGESPAAAPSPTDPTSMSWRAAAGDVHALLGGGLTDAGRWPDDVDQLRRSSPG
jgi:glycosyltransferase involved in cell wall biosynthesis